LIWKQKHGDKFSMTYNEKYVSILRQHDFKVTLPRVKLLEILDGSGEPLSAFDIHKVLSKHGTDLATIYRSLSKFVDAGLLNKIDFGDEFSRYELATNEHYHHFICNECGKVIKIHQCNFDILAKEIERESGHKMLSHEIIFRGLCSECVSVMGSLR